MLDPCSVLLRRLPLRWQKLGVGRLEGGRRSAGNVVKAVLCRCYVPLREGKRSGDASRFDAALEVFCLGVLSGAFRDG